jgi:predicted Ser/Thr protein kinase
LYRKVDSIVTAPTPDFLELQAALAGEYSLQRELGRGGMGVVYLARDVQLDRDVAIKVLPAALAATPSARERFLREARMAAGLSHPHIVPIHRVSEADGFVFFVMSYVEGETLGERLRRRGPLLPAEATRVLREVAWALAYAHGRGIVHRDVKPDNILLEAATGRALVTDFGIAQDAGTGNGSDSAQAESLGEQVMGTQHFMSPEQALGETVDGRSDIYALGVVGHLAVSGRLPFEASDLSALVIRQATETPATVMRFAPGLPSGLAATIDRCLARDPIDRFDDGEELAAALAPATDARPALPPGLRAWLAAKNPLQMPYFAWSGLFGSMATMNLLVWLVGKRPNGPADIVLLAAIASSPIVPIIGFHVNQALRQFRAGHTLADLRGAIAVAAREDAEAEALVSDKEEPRYHRVLRSATVGAGTWTGVTFFMLNMNLINVGPGIPWIFVTPLLLTMGLGALSNALSVKFTPDRLKSWWKAGIRDRLWNSRFGSWIAKRLGAPEKSRAVEGGIFRATEVALGVAAGELFAALPSEYRSQLAELPAIVGSYEARAAEARAEIEMLAAIAPAGRDAEVVATRRAAAKERLAESVAALEGIRLDLLRLHGGANDLAPLTTLIDAAKRIGEDLDRLAQAQKEVDDVVNRRSDPTMG